MFPFDFLREITGIKKKHWEKMGNNIYGSGTEEMCVVWLTNVTDTLPFYNIEEKKIGHFSISPGPTLFPQLYLFLCRTYMSVLKSCDSELFQKGTSVLKHFQNSPNYPHIP